MEHESFVPGMTTGRLVQALRTPEVVLASLPGWQPDAGEAPGGAAMGRLRLRVGGSTITYRGTVAVSGDGPGFTVAAAGAEVRGGGGVTVTAEVSVVTAVQPEAGVTLVWHGTAEAEGRLTTYEPAAVEAAVRRLLDRFCAELAANAPAADARQADVPPGEGAAADAVAEAAAVEAAGTADPSAGAAEVQAVPADEPAAGEDQPEPEAEHAEEAEPAAKEDEPEPDAEDDEPEPAAEEDEPGPAAEEDEPGPAAEEDEPGPAAEEDEPGPAAEPAEEAEPEADVVDDLGEPVPPAELEDFELVEVEVEVPESAAALDDLVPPAEAAHARRTMIGRS
ncbi:SRPBCC domain-containing protein, partial [Actinacidiphila paucisporea]